MISERFDGIQSRISAWQYKALPATERTVGSQIEPTRRGVDALSEAVANYDESPQAKAEVASDAADVIMRMIGLMTIVGVNASEVLENKVNVLYEKYPPEQIYREARVGVPHEVSMRRRAKVWRNRRTQ